MKHIILIATILFLQSAGAAERTKMSLLGLPDDFIVLSNVKENSISVFVSGLSKEGRRCGLIVRSSNLDPLGLYKVLQIRLADQTPSFPTFIEEPTEPGAFPRGLVGLHPNPNSRPFGDVFIIETRSGESIADRLNVIAENTQPEVIVEAVACDQVKTNLQ